MILSHTCFSGRRSVLLCDDISVERRSPVCDNLHEFAFKVTTEKRTDGT